MARNDNPNQMPKGFRIFFGIFMALLYIAVGLLLIFPVFPRLLGSEAVSAAVGGVLCAYGVYRGWRLYKGSNNVF